MKALLRDVRDEEMSTYSATDWPVNTELNLGLNGNEPGVMFGTLLNFTEPHCIFTVPHVQTAEVPTANASSVVTVQLCLSALYLVGEVVAIHLVAVGLASRTLNLDAVALQDGCFFKKTNPIIAYRPLTTCSDVNELTVLTNDSKKPTGRLHLNHHERRT